MLLNHARTLAHEYVTRVGEQFAKNGAFTPEQATYEDWEPVPRAVEAPAVSADCGCSGAVNDSGEAVSLTESVDAAYPHSKKKPA